MSVTLPDDGRAAELILQHIVKSKGGGNFLLGFGIQILFLLKA